MVLERKEDDKIKQKLIKQYDKSMANIEKQAEKAFLAYLNDYMTYVSKQYERYAIDTKSDEIDDSEAEQQARKITNKIFDKKYRNKKTLDEIIKIYLVAAQIAEENFTETYLNNSGTIHAINNKNLLKWLKKYGGDRIVAIDNTTKEITKKIIQEGLENGDSTNDIVRRLTNSSENYNKIRSKRIALTEMHNSYMYSNHTCANANGFRYKKWLTARDNAVRQSHKGLDGMVIKIDEFFPNGLEYPGDWRGSAAETINCRCVLRYMLTENF